MSTDQHSQELQLAVYGRVIPDKGDLHSVCHTRRAVDFVADVDRVVLTVGADAPGAEKPPPAGDAVLPQRSVEDERPPFDIEVDIRVLEDPVEVHLVVPVEVGG
jgi:hypothetical protein